MRLEEFARVEFDPPINCVSGQSIKITHTFSQGPEMPNAANQRNLKAQFDCLSDAHAELTKRAATANARIADADSRNAEKPGSGATSLKFAARQLATLEEDLTAQEKRIARVRAEVVEIRNNLRTI